MGADHHQPAPPFIYVIDKADAKGRASYARPEPRTPYFCGLMVLVNITAFIYSIYLNHWKLEPASVNPMFGPSAHTLREIGAKDTYLIIDCDEIWRLFVAQILHGGIIHLVFNMWALWDVGAGLERHFGTLVSMRSSNAIIIHLFFVGCGSDLPDFWSHWQRRKLHIPAQCHDCGCKWRHLRLIWRHVG